MQEYGDACYLTFEIGNPVRDNSLIVR